MLTPTTLPTSIGCPIMLLTERKTGDRMLLTDPRGKVELMSPPPTWNEVVFADEAAASSLSRAVTRGTLARVGPGIYIRPSRSETAAQIVRRNYLAILAHEVPGAVVTDRSSRRILDPGGRVFVVHARKRPLELPGLTIVPRHGLGPLAGDASLPDGLYIASTPRALIENLAGRGERYLSRAEVERWVADLLDTRGEAHLNAIRDQARAIAHEMGRRAVFDRLDRLIAAALATGPAHAVVTDVLRARAAGRGHDPHRVELFRDLARELESVAPTPLPALPQDRARRRLLPFYEAYFSNYIEGTEFTLDEAASIILDGERPTDRPADAHDIIGTYQVVADETEMARIARSSGEFLDLLKERHATILVGRPEGRPGQFKGRPNRAGSSVFVAPPLVEGTLRAGFDIGAGMIDPFARAAYAMFVVSEVHPFTDGNGRIARVMMNAELVAAAEVRIVVPTVYRNDYLRNLKAATHNGSFRGLIAALRFLRAWTAQIDFSARPAAERDLERTNALRDPNEADASGIRLLLPGAAAD